MATKRENRSEGLRELKTDELAQKLTVLTEEQFRLEFRRATESLTNPLQLLDRLLPPGGRRVLLLGLGHGPTSPRGARPAS